MITAVRTASATVAGDDVVKSYAFNNGTGSLAGTTLLMFEQTTLSCDSGLVIRTIPESSGADFTGTSTGKSGSYISFGSGFLTVQQVPNPSATPYTDLQSVNTFEVAGGVISGVVANQGQGVVIAVAVVPHGASVTASGSRERHGSGVQFHLVKIAGRNVPAHDRRNQVKPGGDTAFGRGGCYGRLL